MRWHTYCSDLEPILPCERMNRVVVCTILIASVRSNRQIVKCGTQALLVRILITEHYARVRLLVAVLQHSQYCQGVNLEISTYLVTSRVSYESLTVIGYIKHNICNKLVIIYLSESWLNG